MVWLIIGAIVALITLFLLFFVILEFLTVRAERKTPLWLRTKKGYPFGWTFLTLFLMVVAVYLILTGLNLAVFYPYDRAGDDEVGVVCEDNHLDVEVWLKKDRSDITDNIRIVLKAYIRSAKAIGLGDVEIESDVLGIDEVFRGEGAGWGSALGGIMGISGHERDEEEFLFSTDQLYRNPIVVTMNVEYVVAIGSGPSMFRNATGHAQIVITIE
jgi:hypothetical protein